MNNWEEKLQKFLENWKYKNDTIGVLVCGSYITGNPSSHSDLDVHIILDEKVDYRERGNKYIDGLLIEYFSNTPNQVKKYFEEDYKNLRPMSQTQFATGKIIFDKTGDVQKLKDEANKMLEDNFKDMDTNINELKKYGIWDMLDDLQDMFENSREDFDFIYFVNLDKLLDTYMKINKLVYDKKTILGHIQSDITRKKYLLKEIPDEKVRNIIVECIMSSNRKIKLENYEKLTNIIFELTGGFNIDTFTFKSAKEI